MKNPSLLQNPYTEISTAKVVVKDDHRRSLNQKKVQELCDSIEQCGLLNPITVSGKGGEFTLVAGYHRLEAVKRIGWKTIPVTVLHSSVPLMIALAAIDENLIRCELSPLELAEALEQRKGIYEKLNPTTKKGGDPSTREKRQNAESALSFAKDTAAKTGKSERVVQENVKLATDLTKSVKDKIRDTPIAGSKEELKALASVPKKEQAGVVDKVLSGKAPSVRAVVEPKKKPPYNGTPQKDDHQDAPPAPIAQTLKEKYGGDTFAKSEQPATVKDSLTVQPAPITDTTGQVSPDADIPWHCGVAPCPDGQNHISIDKIRGKVCNLFGDIGLPCNQLAKERCPVLIRQIKAKEQGFVPATDYDPVSGGKFVRGTPTKITKAPMEILFKPSPKQANFIHEAIASGKFDTPEQVISQALDLWMDQEGV